MFDIRDKFVFRENRYHITADGDLPTGNNFDQKTQLSQTDPIRSHQHLPIDNFEVQNFSICLINARSIVCNTKRQCLTNYLEKYDIDFCFITETWLKQKHPIGFLNEANSIYENFRCDRLRGNGGGVAILYKKSLDLAIIDNISHESGFELCVTDFYFDSNTSKKIRFICGYRPPSLSGDNTQIFVNTINKYLTLGNTFIVGDYNVPHIDWNALSVTRSCASHNIFVDFCIDCGLTQLVKEPTRISKNRDNILDLILTNTENMVSGLTVSETPFLSDHLAVSFKLEVFGKRKTETTHQYLDFKNADFENIEKAFQNINWFTVSESCHNVQDFYDIFVDVCKNVIENHVPKKSKQDYNSKRNRFPKNIRALDRKKNKIWKSIKLFRNDKLLRIIYKELDKEIHQLKKNYLNRTYETVSKHTQKIYKYVKLKMSDQKKLPSLNFNGQIVHDPDQKAKA